MDHLESLFHHLDFTPEESKIYLACLEYGNLPIATISRLTNIGRVNCYHHSEKLVKKGILRASKKNGVRTFSAENPRILVNKEKERMNIVEELLPSLLALSQKTPDRPKVQFFEGKEGIQNLFGIVGDAKNTEVVSFANFMRLEDFFEGSSFLADHFQKRISNNTKTRFISQKSSKSEEFRKKFFPKEFNERLLEIFLISSDEFSFESEITIFSDAIAIMNLSKQSPIGVLIENPELFRTQKAIFDLAWLGATSFMV
ncbi:MAG: helix-turn-helix domain-containing protein [Candidatus Peregrinibacteria bacterium]